MDNRARRELLARYVAGECSAAEEAEVRRWADADPWSRNLLETTQRSWAASGDAGARWNSALAWARVRERMGGAPAAPRAPAPAAPARRRGWAAGPGGARRLAVAASLAVVVGSSLLGLAFWAGGRFGSQPTGVQEIVTRKGQRAQIRLSDGTRVLLAPDSRLLVSRRFGDSGRRVHLVGGAYFDVAPDASRPFVVRAGQTVTRVVGTEFDVQAYPADTSVAVVVAEGRVAFRPAGRSRPEATLLLPGEMGEIAVGGERVVKHPVDVERQLAWRRGRLVFEDARLGDVVVQLERWYGFPVHIGDASLRARRLTATFDDQAIDEVVAIIAASLGLGVSRVGHDYTFVPKRSSSSDGAP